MGTRMRALGDEITQVRRWLNALVTELDRRRHHMTDWKHLAREHAGSIALGALVVAAAVATPLALSQARRRRRSRLSYRSAELADRARRIGRALGRVAKDPDLLAPPPARRALGLAPGALVGFALTMAQLVARFALERRREGTRRA
jgi:hypothetical protein